MATLPRPLAVDAVVAVDAAEWSLFVAPVPSNGSLSLLWMQGLAALVEDRSVQVWAHVGPAQYRLARGEPEGDGMLRFQWDYGDPVYKALAVRSGLRATVVFDRSTDRTVGVR